MLTPLYFNKEEEMALKPKDQEEDTTEKEIKTTTTNKKKTTTNPEEKIVTVIFDEQDGVESNDLFIGVNGKQYQVQRGVEVDVPRSLLNVVNEAVYTKLRYDEHGEPFFKDVPRISYREVKKK